MLTRGVRWTPTTPREVHGRTRSRGVHGRPASVDDLRLLPLRAHRRPHRVQPRPAGRVPVCRGANLTDARRARRTARPERAESQRSVQFERREPRLRTRTPHPADRRQRQQTRRRPTRRQDRTHPRSRHRRTHRRTNLGASRRPPTRSPAGGCDRARPWRFLLKNPPPEELFHAVRGNGPGVEGRRRQPRPPDRPRTRGPRFAGRRKSNAEIASSLYVDEGTVKTHVSHILTNLSLRDRMQAVVFAYESGLITPGCDDLILAVSSCPRGFHPWSERRSAIASSRKLTPHWRTTLE